MRSGRARIFLIVIGRIIGFTVAIAALLYGLKLRDDAWTWSTPIRFHGDISNGLHQGTAVLEEAGSLANADGLPAAQTTDDQVPWKYILRGFVRRYDTVVAQSTDDRYGLDYTPARLLVMTIWARHAHRVDPAQNEYRDEFADPLLKFNTGCEIVAALFMFLLVRHWILRSGSGSKETAWMLGLLAALVSWFNPSTITDAHMWPQWDVWIVPFYLMAMYLASVEWWFTAGMCVAIGVLFKGQMLMIAPVLLLWPLFQWKKSETARSFLGFGFAGALAASPWLSQSRQAVEWIGSVMLLTCVLIVMGRRNRTGRSRWPIWTAIPVVAFVIHPAGPAHLEFVALALAVAFSPWIGKYLTRSDNLVWLAAIATACIALGASAFNGSWTWYTVGFEFPTHHYLNMANGGCSNLAAILGIRYHWNVDDIVAGTNIRIKTLLIIIYGFTVLLCGIGAGLHDRRNDASVLISLTAPWVLMFALLPQMHERYLTWAAAVCGVAVAVSVGMSLMHLLVMALSLCIFGHDLLMQDRSFMPEAYHILDRTHPDIGWMVLLTAAVFLFAAVVPRRRSRATFSNIPGATQRAGAVDFDELRSYAVGYANEPSETAGPAGAVPADPQ